MEPLNQECERARFCASLALDGALSELEHAALDAHLRTCEACRLHVDGVNTLTASLRGAPLLEPPPLALPMVRHARLRPSFVAAAVVVVAVAVGAGSLVGTLSSRSTRHAQRAATAAQRPFIEQQLLALANGVAGPERGRASGRAIAS